MRKSGSRKCRNVRPGPDEIELQRLNAAFLEVKKMTGPRSKPCYRSVEYRALQKHRRGMKRQQQPTKKEKKSRKERDARYYQSKKQRIQEREAEKKRGMDEISALHQNNHAMEQHEVQKQKEENQLLTEKMAA